MPRDPEAPASALRTILIGLQIAMSVVLVVGALLLVRTVANVQAINPGFNVDRMFSFRLAARPSDRSRTSPSAGSCRTPWRRSPE